MTFKMYIPFLRKAIIVNKLEMSFEITCAAYLSDVTSFTIKYQQMLEEANQGYLLTKYSSSEEIQTSSNIKIRFVQVKLRFCKCSTYADNTRKQLVFGHSFPMLN